MASLGGHPAGVVLACFGGHGRDIAATLGRGLIGYYDDGPVPDKLGDLNDWLADPRQWLVAVNDPMLRARIAHRHPGRPWRRGVWVHPSATIGPDVRVGDHTHINAACTATRATFGRFCTVSPGVTVAGDVTVGDSVSLGAGCVISNLVEIGDFAVIGAGAVVPPRTVIPAGSTWVSRGLLAERVR